MAIDISYLGTLYREREAALSRHLIHYPEDEQHPLMHLVHALMEDATYAPELVAYEHVSERDRLITRARTMRSYCGWMKDWREKRDTMVAQARWHNHQAIACRKG